MKKAPNRHRQGEKLIAATIFFFGSTKAKGTEVFLTERQWNSVYKRKSFHGYRVSRVKRGHSNVKKLQEAVSSLQSIRRKLQEQRELPVLPTGQVASAQEAGTNS